MNNNELNNMINKFIQSNNMKTNRNDLKNKEKVDNLLKNLDSKQADTLKQLLSDPQKSQDILNSPAAKALMKKLMK